MKILSVDNNFNQIEEKEIPLLVLVTLTLGGSWFFILKKCKRYKVHRRPKNFTSNICIRKVLIDLLLSITVSLPTSSRPICFGSIPYFSRREVTTVKLKIQELRCQEDPFKYRTKILKLTAVSRYKTTQIFAQQKN